MRASGDIWGSRKCIKIDASKVSLMSEAVTSPECKLRGPRRGCKRRSQSEDDGGAEELQTGASPAPRTGGEPRDRPSPSRRRPARPRPRSRWLTPAEVRAVTSRPGRAARATLAKTKCRDLAAQPRMSQTNEGPVGIERPAQMEQARIDSDERDDQAQPGSSDGTLPPWLGARLQRDTRPPTPGSAPASPPRGDEHAPGRCGSNLPPAPALGRGDW